MRRGLLFILLFGLLFISGCVESSIESDYADGYKEENPTSQEPTQPTDTELTIDTAIEKMKSVGYSVSEKREVSYQLIRAYDGTKVDIDNITVGIYQYLDINQEIKLQTMKQLKTVDNNLFEVGPLLFLVHSTNISFSRDLYLLLDLY